MFTGIIEEVGSLSALKPKGASVEITVGCRVILEGLRRGDSIAVDGCCLTVEEFNASGFRAHASPETLEKTSLGDRRPGDGVNLERALALGGRLGGHLVSGHVDGTGAFQSARKADQSWETTFTAPRPLLGQCIQKGSIAIDGVSLTIASLGEDSFTVWLIPETWERTTLSRKKPGERVNLETDMIGKYVHRFLEQSLAVPADPAEKDRRLADLLRGGNWGQR